MKAIKSFFRKLGPGFITGASDDDPAGVATYSITGAMFGFAQLWLCLFTIPLMIVVQEMCGRIGIVTGRGLAAVIKKHYSKKILYGCVLLLFVANIINIGADLGAMAASAQLLVPVSYPFLLFGMTIFILVLEVFVEYKTYVKYLKYLAFSLFAYVATAFVVYVDWKEVFFATFTPTILFTKEYLLNIVAFLGTSISPYLFFWQASEEVEDEVAHHKLRRMGAGVPHVTPKDITDLRQDTAVGMFFSQLVAWFIILTTGATLHRQGLTSIQSATDAASALRPLAGDFAFILFAAGIISTGLLAVPVLSGSASYAIAETFSWKEGLYRKLRQARGFYIVVIIATLLGLFLNFSGVNPFEALYLSAVVNGIIAPPLLIMIVVIANNKNILGQRVNGRAINMFSMITILVMSVASIILFYTLIFR